MVRVLGIGWLGTRTGRFDETVGFATEVLDLRPAVRGADVAVFRLPEGDEFEVFGPDNGDLLFREASVAAFLVVDVEEARAEMNAKGATFLGPTEGRGGLAWAYFHAPDGHVYELTSRPPDAPSEPGASER